MLKINEEEAAKLLVLLSAQYIEVMDMLMNKKELTYFTIPKIQAAYLHFLILRLSKLEPKIKSINSINDLVEEVQNDET